MFAGRIQRIAVALLPQAVNHGRHQPQHAARALELHQGRPVRVQAVEDLGMDRIGGFDPLFVVDVPTLRRKLLVLGPIELRKCPRDHVPVLELRRVRERLEEPSPHDFEAFLGTCRPPGRLDASDDVPQAIERLAPALPTDLDIIGPGMGRPGRIGGRQADHEQAVVGELGGFRQRLGKAELGLEAAGGKVALVVQLASVGHPLVNEDLAGAVFVEEFAQCIARVCRVLVVRRDTGKCLLAAQLPRQLAPEGSNHRAVGFRHRVPRRDLVADQHHPPGRPELRCLRFLEHGVDSGQISRCGPREQVIQGEHGVGLAAPEVRLQLNDGVAAPTREAVDCPDQQALQAFGQVGPPKELDGVAVLVGPFAEVHLPEVGRELGLLVPPARDIPVRCDDFPPWLEAGRGGASDGGARLPAPFPARLLVEAHPQQLHLEPFELVRLRRRYRGEETAHRIQCPIGVIAGEALLVGPSVAVVTQLTDETPVRPP